VQAKAQHQEGYIAILIFKTNQTFICSIYKNQHEMARGFLLRYFAIPFLFLVFSIPAAMSISNILTQQQALAQNTTTSSSSTKSSLPTTTNFSTYQNPVYGIKIQYPSDWTVSQTGLRDHTNIVGFYSPVQNLSATSSSERLLLSKIHYSQVITLNDYGKVVNDTLQQTRVQIVESKPVTLAGGSPAYRVVFIPPSANEVFIKPQEIMLVWTVKDKNVYTLLYSTEAAKYSAHLPTIQKMITSLEITK
jgi:hypothetical protein